MLQINNIILNLIDLITGFDLYSAFSKLSSHRVVEEKRRSKRYLFQTLASGKGGQSHIFSRFFALVIVAAQ